MKPTDIHDHEHFHKVIDCQYACPAHTPVPEYIRLIAQGRYTEAYMINWASNVFPGVLGRTCDRPCEPACRRGRIEAEPVAICRLKRVAADNKGDVCALLPQVQAAPNGKKVALIGGGPASLAVARDLAPCGYEIHLFDEHRMAGGMMRCEIPSFRLPEETLNEEVGFILDMGIHRHFNTYVPSLKGVLDQDYDAVFIGTGAPRGRDLPDLSGRQEASANIHIGLTWLANVAFGHVTGIGRRVLVLGGGNTAMDCCRTARRLGGEDVKVVVRSPFAEMKASPWEKEDARHEGIPIIDNHVPLEFVVENGTLTGMRFDRVHAVYDEKGRRQLVSTGEPPVLLECDEVLVAIGQENSFPWIERDIGLDFGKWDMPVVDELTLQSSLPRVFFGGDAAFGPKNIITAVAQAHQAAVSIDLFLRGKDVRQRPAPGVTLVSQKMGVHEWIYDNLVVNDKRYPVLHADLTAALKDRLLEAELGFDQASALKEVQRCLNCDAQTVFTPERCIECDACADICPTDCINFIANDEEARLRSHLRVPARHLDKPLYVSAELPNRTGRVMVKDENVCLHCGLCAERCPTSAWDMQKFFYTDTQAGQSVCAK